VLRPGPARGWRNRFPRVPGSCAAGR
jgi:hypothetical protein